MNDSANSQPQRWGIERSYVDALGQEQTASDETIERLLVKLGVEEHPEGPPPPATIIVWQGEPMPQVPPGKLILEDGGDVRVTTGLPANLSLGYHELVPDEGPPRTLIVSPPKCFLPREPQVWGWAVQLYAARSQQSWGVGDFGDLGQLAAWTRREGGGALMVNPLHAAAPIAEQQPSPYFPTSRRFLSPLYLRIEDLPGANEVGQPLAELAAAGRALSERRIIDRDAVWKLKRAALDMLWSRWSQSSARDSEFNAWCKQRGDSLLQFCTWCALAERHGANWRRWPAELRHPRQPAVRRFAEDARERVQFYAWVQWLCERQLMRAVEPLTVIQDLPIGFDPDGADAWSFQDVLANGVKVGAPPDEFNTQGQDWGLPPFVPWKLDAVGFRPFVETLRATMVEGGGIRIDHVMGLYRLWWIPEGASAKDGAYVRGPSDAFLAILALESHRARAPVVGEDLGTVEESFRDEMRKRQVLSYRVLWFEEDEPKKWPEQALAAVTTHDLPTVAGMWSGSDLEEQKRLGMQPNEAGAQQLRERVAGRMNLPDGADDAAAVVGAHQLLAMAPCRYVIATLEDAVGERERPNIPGADEQRPNWSIGLPVRLDELPRQPLCRAITTALVDGVRTDREEERAKREKGGRDGGLKR